MTSRLDRLDALKGVAIVAVVAIHALATGVTGLDRWHVAAIGGVLTASVPVFMAAAVWSAAAEYGRTGRGAVVRRLPRLALPYAAATVSYVALALATNGPERTRLDHEPGWSVAAFGGAWYHLYFLPALAQVLLLMPLVARAARSRLATVAALVAGASLLATGPFAGGTLADALDLRWGLVWLPAAIVGAAVGLGTLRFSRPAALAAAGLALLAVEGIVAAEQGAGGATAYARLGAVAVTAGALAAATTPGGAPRWLVALGRRSLGVYLLHPAVLLVLSLLRDREPYGLAAVPLVTALVTAVAWLATVVLAGTPAAPVVGGPGPAGPWGGRTAVAVEQTPVRLVEADS